MSKDKKGGHFDENAPPEAKVTAADLFVKCLENEGVEIIFGLPGEENADFVVALSKSKQIKYILVRHEQGAAFMADAYGRLTGKPGVCFGTLGPGAANLVTGVADGNMDHAPMVIITGQADTYRLHKESHQNMDVLGMFKPIVKWNTSIYHAESIPEIVHKAFKIAQLEKCGATHIELPEDVAGSSAVGLEPLPKLEKLRRSVPDDKIIDQIWERVRHAKHPVIIAGNGVLRHRSSKQLELFCDATNIPVVMTFMAKGAVPASKPYCLFTVGLASGDMNNMVLESADLVLAFGFDMVEYHPRSWNPKKNLAICHVDFTAAEVDAYYRCTHEAVGDLSHSLWMLNERAKAHPVRVSDDYYKNIRTALLADFAENKDDKTEGIIRPQKVLWDVRQALGSSDIVLSDVGAHKMWIARYLQCEEPNTCLISNGFCSMGFALPGAIGAKLAYPDKRVLAICGDGGFLMNVQEMETAKRVGANIVVMVWCDGGYGLIAWKQDNRYGHHTALEFSNPNFELLAHAFGWKSYVVNNAVDLKPALDDAFKQNSPALIALKIDYTENPKLTARLGKFRHRE